MQKYLEATKYGGNCPDDVRKALKEAGIQLNRRHIQTTLNKIRQNAKAAERLKHPTKSRSKHDTTLEEELNELAASEDDNAEVPEETEEVDIAETA